jgi:hypothetical protein
MCCSYGVGSSVDAVRRRCVLMTILRSTDTDAATIAAANTTSIAAATVTATMTLTTGSARSVFQDACGDSVPAFHSAQCTTMCCHTSALLRAQAQRPQTPQAQKLPTEN